MTHPKNKNLEIIREREKMDIIEFLFGAKEKTVEPKAKPKIKRKLKKQKRKYTKENLRYDRERGYAVQIKKTNDILEDKSTEDLQEMEEEIRNEN